MLDLSHDIIQKSNAGIADNIKKNEDGCYLIIFNSLSVKRSDIMRVSMREFENSEVVMNSKNGILSALIRISPFPSF